MLLKVRPNKGSKVGNRDRDTRREQNSHSPPNAFFEKHTARRWGEHRRVNITTSHAVNTQTGKKMGNATLTKTC